MTTNGSQLPRYAESLRRAGVRRLNISLDSLDPDRFHRITRTGKLAKVLEGIEAAREAGFDRIKINTVAMKNRNDDEILDLVDFVVARGWTSASSRRCRWARSKTTTAPRSSCPATRCASASARAIPWSPPPLPPGAVALLQGQRHRQQGRLHLAAQP